MEKKLFNKEKIIFFSLNIFLILYIFFSLISFKINKINIFNIYNLLFYMLLILEIIIFILRLLISKKENYSNIKSYLDNLIFYLSIPIISNIYFNTFFETTIQTKLGFIYSFFIGIFIIFNTNFLIINKKEDIKKLFIPLLVTFFYIIFIINNCNLLNIFNIPTGIINFINYSLKILLFSGVCIPINLFLENKDQKESSLLILLIKIIIFTTISLLSIIIFKLKGLLYIIAIFEIIKFVINIINNKTQNQTKQK